MLLTIPASATPHLIHGLRGGFYAVTGPAGVYWYGPSTAAGCLAFLSANSGAYVIQAIEGGGPADVPSPPVGPPPVKPPSRCGRFGLEIIGLGAIASRRSWYRLGHP